MATTTNYGWETPDDTDLVKDGASAIRTLGSSIDTTTKSLNPSTTLGDIEYRSSTANTNTRLGIGSSGQVLTVSGGVPAWTTLSSGGMTELATGSLSGSSVTISSISQDYVNLELYVYGHSSSAGVDNGIRLNGVSTNSYQSTYMRTNSTTVISTGAYNQIPCNPGSAGSGICFTRVIINNYANTSSWRTVNFIGMRNGLGWIGGGIYEASTAISSITILFDGTATFASGTYKLYGVK